MKIFGRLGFGLGFGLALITLSGGVHAEPTAASADQPTPEAVILNYIKVWPGKLSRGARPNDAGIQALIHAHFRTVINLQGGDLESAIMRPLVKMLEPGEKSSAILEERHEAEVGGMAFVHKPLNSSHQITAAEDAEIDETLRVMNDPKSQPVFIHCEHGHDRTGLLVALYRVRYDGWNADEAHEEMVNSGHKGFVNHLVTGKLDKYFYQKAPKLAQAYAREHSKDLDEGSIK